MKALLFDIKRYAIHDGPGIRLTFFLKGCPLSCHWCHNPEGISPEIQTYTRVDRIGEREFPVETVAGRYLEMDALLKEVEKERIFMEESGGGVTFSGGEPLMQPAFLLEALEVLGDKGIHTVVDTSGFAKAELMEKVGRKASLMLFDLKMLDPRKHTHYCGQSNTDILRNLEALLEAGRKIWLRIPLIPGVNDSAEELHLLYEYLKKQNTASVEQIHLLPYHSTGASKYARFGMPYTLEEIPDADPEIIAEWQHRLLDLDIPVRQGG